MGLDTKYRPESFDKVLGQDSTVDILRSLLEEGRIYEQSYVFAGPSGTGKTTTARILARAMLCEKEVDGESYSRVHGEPCNDCASCTEILRKGHSAAFREMDAANNSGKQDIERILEEMNYYTLGGSDRRIYLMDEAHSLSSAAMDALLKPLEDNVPGSDDKRLVCLFCTTEPENLRKTIRSRSMVFRIHQPPEDLVFDRLAEIAENEGIVYEDDALDLIIDHARGHMRDMLVSMDRVARTGSLTVEAVKKSLGLEMKDLHYRILEHLPSSIDKSLELTREALDYSDPSAIASGVGSAALAVWRLENGIETGMTSMDRELASDASSSVGGEALLTARRMLLGDRIGSVNALVCRLMMLHEELNDGVVPAASPDVKMSGERAVKTDASDGTVEDEGGSDGDRKADDRARDSESEEPSDRARRHREEAAKVSENGLEGLKEGGPDRGRNTPSGEGEEKPDTAEREYRPTEEGDLKAVWKRLDD